MVFCKRKRKGNTLIEVVLSTVMFVVIMAMVYIITSETTSATKEEINTITVYNDIDNFTYNIYIEVKSSSELRSSDADKLSIFTSTDVVQYEFDNEERKLYRNAELIAENIDGYFWLTSKDEVLVHYNYLDVGSEFTLRRPEQW